MTGPFALAFSGASGSGNLLHTAPMPYSLVIFDLDGTLVDSFPWFLRNINDTAE